MAARRPTTARLAALTLALVVAGCSSDPATVLQTDLPQIPGMTGRESSGVRQAGGVVEAGTFAYKGAVSELGKQVEATRTAFTSRGWTLESERRTPATATLVFAKDRRRARVEIIRNDLAPGMSTAVTRVETQSASAPQPSR